MSEVVKCTIEAVAAFQAWSADPRGKKSYKRMERANAALGFELINSQLPRGYFEIVVKPEPAAASKQPRKRKGK